jgi:hypothetical protein
MGWTGAVSKLRKELVEVCAIAISQLNAKTAKLVKILMNTGDKISSFNIREKKQIFGLGPASARQAAEPSEALACSEVSPVRHYPVLQKTAIMPSALGIIQTRHRGLDAALETAWQSVVLPERS